MKVLLGLCLSLTMMMAVPSLAQTSEAPSMAPTRENELIISFYSETSGCNNTLDEARILVAIADFLETYYSLNGQIPDPQSLPRDATCTEKFRQCDIALGGGCCKGSKCKVTSNGLEVCVNPSYEPNRVPINGYCTRGQPCEEGLVCENDPADVTQKICVLPTGRRLLRIGSGNDVGMIPANGTLDEPKILSFGEWNYDVHKRSLFNREWCKTGRKCGDRCTWSNWLASSKRQRDAITKYCKEYCMFSGCKKRRRRLMTTEEQDQAAHMTNFIASLAAYLDLLDFGDDCRTNQLTFGWRMGQPQDGSE